MLKKIIILAIVSVLLAPCIYFHFQYFRNFMKFVALRTPEEQERQRAQDEGTQKSKEEYNQERLSAVNEIYNDIPLIEKALGLANKNFIPTQFWFKEGASDEFYVQAENNGAKIKFLIYTGEIENISETPIYYIKNGQSDETQQLLKVQLQAMFSIPSVLFVDFFFHEDTVSKNAVTIFMGLAYFEEENDAWVLKAGNDLLGDENLVSYKYNCNSFTWVKQHN